MAEQHLLVDDREQPHHLQRAVVGHLEVESAGQMQRLEILHPGEGDVIVAPGTRDRDGDLVLAGALERPVMRLRHMLDDVDGMQVARDFEFDQAQGNASPCSGAQRAHHPHRHTRRPGFARAEWDTQGTLAGPHPTGFRRVPNHAANSVY
jgi:hypothetical protein